MKALNVSSTAGIKSRNKRVCASIARAGVCPRPARPRVACASKLVDPLLGAPLTAFGRICRARDRGLLPPSAFSC